MNFLVIDGVRKEFDKATALDGIDLSIEKGELVCILGPSGCGKTTLLRIIAGLETPTSGRIFLDGKDCTEAPPGKRDFGIVFQSYALFPNMTVEQNILFGLNQQKGLSKAEKLRKVDEVIDMVDLERHRKKHPGQLSGGQQQRTALARALAPSPKYLLLDEPLSALDAKVRLKLRGKICDIQRQLGITTVMVTHDQEEALTMADRVVVMNDAMIEQVGTPQEIYNSPATPFVANFIGTMNFYERAGATLGIRPEHVLLSLPDDEAFRKADPRDSDSETLRGVVTRVEFKGSQTRVFGLVDGAASNGEAAALCADIPSKRARDMGLWQFRGETQTELCFQMPKRHLITYDA